MRNAIFTTGSDLKGFLQDMTPMFPAKVFPGTKKPKSGKYSFTEEKRAEIFSFIIKEIRKYSDCPIALCKEFSAVWKVLGLELSRCQCVCQLDYADMTAHFSGRTGA
jgi:spore photoproduct lyase